MELHRIGVKIFAEESDSVALTEFIPVFHGWIQRHSLDGMLIDVADYSHVFAGPGTLLVAHEGNYGYDESGNRRGMVYYSKHPIPGDPAERLAAVCRRALQACRLVEQDQSLKGRIRFPGRQLQVFANERLNAPNTAATFDGFRPVLQQLLARLYPGANCRLQRETDERERFAITIDSGMQVSVQDLLERLSQ